MCMRGRIFTRPLAEPARPERARQMPRSFAPDTVSVQTSDTRDALHRATFAIGIFAIFAVPFVRIMTGLAQT